jgi:hypothetical protein
MTLLDPVPQCPDVSDLSWWDEFRPAWSEVVAQRPVDVIRTDALVDWNLRVRVSGNTPLQLCASSYTQTLTTKIPPTKGYDEYAKRSGFGFEPPRQALAVVTPERGIVQQMPVYAV